MKDHPKKSSKDFLARLDDWNQEKGEVSPFHGCCTLSDVGSSLRFMLVCVLRGSCWTTRCSRLSVRDGVTSSVSWVVWRGYDGGSNLLRFVVLRGVWDGMYYPLWIMCCVGINGFPAAF